jgi:hypothetical protein
VLSVRIERDHCAHAESKRLRETALEGHSLA